jgi:hypothetical protein
VTTFTAEPVVFAAPKKATAAVAIALAAALASQIEDLAQSLADGDLDESEFVDQVRALLVAAGQDAAVGISDDDFVEKLVAGKMDYLDGFAGDIAGGGMSVEAIAARAALWGGVAYLAYQMAKVNRAANGDDPPMTWSGTDDDRTCDDCRELIGTTRKASEWDVYPGDVQCSGNDRCSLDDAEPGARFSVRGPAYAIV